MSGNKRDEETFLTRVGPAWRITILVLIRESLGLEMGDHVRVTIGEETFPSKVHKGWRVTVYEPIRERLGLEIGDRVRVTIRKDPIRKLTKK